jgi:hypothetical protein
MTGMIQDISYCLVLVKATPQTISAFLGHNLLPYFREAVLSDLFTV